MSPTASPRTEDRLYIPALTGVRAVAAWMVFAHHFFLAFPLANPWRGMLRECHVGVSLFFVLSGFLIYHRYAASAAMRASFWGSYLRNRAARVYPLYLLLTCVTLLVQPMHPRLVRWIWLSNLTLTKGFSDRLNFTGIGQTWSLTVEECFYLTAPLVFLAARRFRFAPVALVSVLLLWTSGYAIYGLVRHAISYTYFGRCVEFFVGMGLAHALRRDGVARTAAARPPAAVAWSTYGGLAGIALVLYVLARLGTDPDKFGVFTAPGQALNNLVLPVFVALWFRGLVLERSALARLLGSRPFDLLGKASYAFYLIHLGVIQFRLMTWFPLDPGVPPPAMVALLGDAAPATRLSRLGFHFVLLNVIALVLYVAVEHPLNQLLRSRSRRPLPDTQAEATAAVAAGVPAGSAGGAGAA